MLLFIDLSLCSSGTKMYCFNTSHVTLYHIGTRYNRFGRKVSIHHMLLFINFEKPHSEFQMGFNTSHVTLYPAAEFTVRVPSGFNTSHVTLYPETTTKGAGYMLFQYITCYSLSVDRMLCNTVFECFNTSHVTLYHLRRLPLLHL